MERFQRRARVLLTLQATRKPTTTKDDDYPIIYRVLTIPGGAPFCPSTVSHQTREFGTSSTQKCRLGDVSSQEGINRLFWF